MELAHALRIQHRELVALVGGGGKTSAMFRLGDELSARGWRVVLTTSTHLAAAQVDQAPHVVYQPADQLTDQLTNQLTDQPLARSPTLLISGIDPATNKAQGLRPEVIDRILEVLGVDAVVNEADGARQLSLKAPADHEPVVSPATTLALLVVGIDAVGRPLDGAYVHRPERFAALSGAALGQTITPEMIAAVLTHPQGGLKGIPPTARVMVLINKVHQERAIAQELAGRLLQAPRVEAVAIGAVREADPIRRVESRVAAVVLAAGESRRFGRLKQLEPWGRGTLLTHAVEVALASPAEPVVVVLGCQAEACRAALAAHPPEAASPSRRPVIVVNPDWAGGQSISVRAGLAALPDNVGGVIFHLADQPHVTPAVMRALIERHATTLAPVLWPEYRGQRGNPALLDRVTFSQLHQLTGDLGARPVLMRYARAGAVERVPVDEPGVLQDVDSPQDLDQA